MKKDENYDPNREKAVSTSEYEDGWDGEERFVPNELRTGGGEEEASDDWNEGGSDDWNVVANEA